MYLSAAFAGLRFIASNLARMKASIGVRTHLTLRTAGTGESFIGWKAQKCFCSSVNKCPGLGESIFAASTVGQTAPFFTQASSTAMSASDNRPLGGILRSSFL